MCAGIPADALDVLKKENERRPLNRRVPMQCGEKIRCENIGGKRTKPKCAILEVSSETIKELKSVSRLTEGH